MQINSIVKPILSWYQSEKRILPFRGIDDPYKIWLSEIMLQQTQVKTVVPYYNRWIKRYPSIKSVALADRGAVLKMWEGLGYYTRCRNFHTAAKIVVKRFNGIIPNDWENFSSLPGVGDYTAAAVLSIAFNKPYAVMDGNAKRVMSRILGIKNLTSWNLSRINKTLSNIIPEHTPGNFNQSVMELGATLCTPRSPSCNKCPLSFGCKAFKTNKPDYYPKPAAKKRKPHYTIVAGIIWRDNTFFIQRRPEKAMLGGLWEFPGGKVEEGESLEAALKREIKEECGVVPSIKKRIGAVDHSYSHFSITFHGYHCIENGEKINKVDHSAWITPDQIDQFPFPKANHKLFKIINEQGWHV